jgi:hypothetical protein
MVNASCNDGVNASVLLWRDNPNKSETIAAMGLLGGVSPG